MATFKEAYARLNPEQKKAVDTIAGPVMVIAGPGTGKTEVLTMRIANICERGGADGTGVAPERVLALTFTESGVVSMRRRLAELIGQGAYRARIATFHGFANSIIHDHPDYFPEVLGAASITEIDQVSILRGLLDSLPLKELRPFGERYHYLKNILAAINELKRQGVAPDAFAAIVKKTKEDFAHIPDLVHEKGRFEGKMKGKYADALKYINRNDELAVIYAAYQEKLRAAKQYDYSDMIMFVMIALEKNDELAQAVAESYDYYLVDEHQDTNKAQNRIVELIVSGPGAGGKEAAAKGKAAAGNSAPNLFVVGDEKQAIFRFQGASLENFHYFKNHYKDVALIPLRNNYRSTQAILDAAEAVSPRDDAQLVAKAGHKESPAHLVALASPDIEYYFIAEKVKELIAGGKGAPVAPEEIAVLYRENRDAAPLADMLEKEGVAFNIESDQDVLGDEDIKKLIRILRAVQHFGNDASLVEALHVDFVGIPPIDIYKLAAFARREHVKIYDVLRSPAFLEKAGIEPTSKDACLKLFNGLSDWKRQSKNRGAAVVFETIVSESGFLASLLHNASATEKIAKLHALFDLLKSFIERQKNYTLDDFFTYLDLIEEHGIAIKGKETVRLPGRIRLMTAHRSKGLEFDYVFVMGSLDGKWGSRTRHESIRLPEEIYRTDDDEAEVAAELADGDGDEAEGDAKAEQALSDERNLFYVALTRARKELFVCYSKLNRDGKEQLPTQFVAELKEDILAPFDASPYESRFAEHREIEFTPAPARAPELRDKEFLNALFRDQGISVTALNNYLECPWRYFYLNLIRIPEAPNKHLAFGNAVHAAMKSYFDALADGTDKGKAYLVARFEEALKEEPVDESDYEETLEKGRKALPAYYDLYHAGWNPRAISETRVDGVTVEVEGGVKGEAIAINGKLDKIEFIDDTHVNVIDYKTGKPKTRNEIEGNTKDADGNYKRQLVFYKLLLGKQGKYDMEKGVIEFIEPDERGKFHREEFSVAQDEVAALEKTIAEVSREILNLAFWDRTCGEEDCKYCGLRKGMG